MRRAVTPARVTLGDLLNVQGPGHPLTLGLRSELVDGAPEILILSAIVDVNNCK